MTKCESYCRELRHVLRRQEDLEAQAREMYELDHTKDQIMTVLKLGLANLGMCVRDQYFGESYQHCGWQRFQAWWVGDHDDKRAAAAIVRLQQPGAGT